MIPRTAHQALLTALLGGTCTPCVGEAGTASIADPPASTDPSLANAANAESLAAAIAFRTAIASRNASPRAVVEQFARQLAEALNSPVADTVAEPEETAAPEASTFVPDEAPLSETAPFARREAATLSAPFAVRVELVDVFAAADADIFPRADSVELALALSVPSAESAPAPFAVAVVLACAAPAETIAPDPLSAAITAARTEPLATISKIA